MSDFTDSGKAVALLGACLLMVFACFGLASLVSAAWSPKVNDMQTQGFEHSYTVVQTKKELLVRLVQDYRRLEAQQALNKDKPDVVAALEAQKTATRDRVRSEASTLKPNEVPPEALPFL